MNTAFLKFNDDLLGSGALQQKQTLAQGLRQTTELFLKLAHITAASPESDHEDEGVANPGDNKKRLSSEEIETSLPNKKRRGSAQSTNPVPHASKTAPMETARAPDSHMQDHANEHLSRQTVAVAVPQLEKVMEAEENVIDLIGARPPLALQQYRAQVPSLDQYADAFSSSLGLHPVQPLFTFNFQETTFARRLHRACLERGYHLLLNPDANPGAVKRVFELTMRHNSREQILKRIRELLVRSNKEELDFLPTLINIGGAGTHYPRIEPATKDVQSLNAPAKPMGPAKIDILSLAKDLPADVNPREFEGDWFDAGDVDGFLKEKGVFIEPSASFAEFEILDPAPAAQSPSSNGSLASHSSPQTPQSDYSPNQSAFPDLSFFQTGLPNSPDLFDFGNSTSTMTPLGDTFASLDKNVGQSYFGVLPSDSPVSSNLDFSFSTPPQAPPLMKRVVTVDIDFFVDSKSFLARRLPIQIDHLLTLIFPYSGILSKGVCLGRSPGFRRRDVEDAFRAAMQVY
ncbi:hypothetical protein L228DRAFT_247583 [Xylona heveae TC161]|uniref:Uncharacterized protein n=1 Tax=Xylona heveae (strain CBS 132557 / TC161) TaxID=1328760 RepID=A0A165GB41_XYLHT|nr:hypothetical protein L228DRAFT_247583 [Xylona heveae TC161]KZF21973.1 hypothetical protein L228DRAFT_247583 [Xylona heveae TC161]